MIKEFSLLRIILLLLIFLFHSGYLADGAGIMAVACFFVLGGFCSVLGYAEWVIDADFHYGRYLVNRLIKYYPLHWLYLLIALLFGGQLFVKTLIVNSFLFQSWIPISSVYFSYNGVSWYLCDVVFFVWICPFVLRFLQKMSDLGLIAMLFVIIAFYWVLALIIPIQWYHPILYINPLVRSLDFIIGAIAGIMFLRKRDKTFSKHLCLLIAFGSLLTLIILALIIPKELQLISAIYWPFILLLIGGLALGQGGLKLLVHPILLKLGECGFSFYMSHQLCIGIFGKLLGGLGVNSQMLTMIIVLTLTVCVAYLSRIYFEIPVSKWLKLKTNRLFMTARS